jgi:hypothetical protein
MDDGPPTYERLDVANVTPRTAPPYATISFAERNSRFVLTTRDGSGRMLIGPLGVNYFLDGRPDHATFFLRRWDMPPFRSRGRSQSGYDPQESGG